MITPAEIQSIEFAKAVRGYKEEDVNAFLDQLTIDMEQLLKENEDLKNKLEESEKKLGEYKSTEGAVLSTLQAAKALMSDISASAEKRAEVLLKNAELDADLRLRQASDSVERLKEEEMSLAQKVMGFKTRFKSMLEAELEKFDDLSSDIFEDLKNGNRFNIAGKEGDVAIDSFEKLNAVTDTSEKEDLSKTLTNIRSK